MSLQRNALLLALLTGVLAILGQWNPALARWWCLPAGVLLAGLAWEAAVTGRCRVQLRLTGPERWLLGRRYAMQLAFAQSARANAWIQAALAAPAEFAAEARVETLRLTRNLETTATLQASARRLGRFAWPAPQVRLSGPWRLAWWPKRLPLECAVIVVADVVSRRATTTADSKGGEQRTHVATGGVAQILQLREYRHGDPLRLLDWKASARRGRLISRELAEERHLEIMIAIDAGGSSGLAAGEIDRLGLYVNVAARLAQRASDMDDAAGVLVFASRPLVLLPPARGTAAVVRIRRVLAACRVQPGMSNPALAAARIRATSHRRTLIVLLTDLADAPQDELLQAVRLLSPKHFTVIAGLENPRIMALPLARAEEPLSAYRSLAATEYRRALSSNVRALRALGAAALTARPERLDQAVFAAYRAARLRRRV